MCFQLSIILPVFPLLPFPFQEAQRDQHRARQELEDSQRIIELLNQKLHVLSDRAVELEAQTAQFHSLSPVLEKLMERFGFTSPERAVKMMEDLQNKEISLFSEISSLQMENSALQGKVWLPQHFSSSQFSSSNFILYHSDITSTFLSPTSSLSFSPLMIPDPRNGERPHPRDECEAC